MKDIVSEYQELFRRHRIQLRRYTAFLLALAMITTLFVNWQLHSDGIAKTADYQCGEEEHTHTADCYQKVLVCGYEEGEPEDGTVAEPDSSMDAAFGVYSDESSAAAVYSAEPEYIFVPHEHTDACYQEVKTLTCLEEEHVHGDDCFDPEDGSLICDLFEHTHDDSCYDTEYELVCGLDEGELVEELNPNYNPAALFEEPVAAKPVVVAPVVEAPVHHHTDACYEEELVCTLPEHHHTVNCLADPFADVEDESEWLAKTDTTLDNIWTDDLLTVAKSQLGYEQSEKNFELDSDDGQTLRHYTRYGQWYGNPYGAWDVMFLSYCLNYAGIPQSAIPQRAGVQALLSDLRGAEYVGSFEGDMPLDAVMPGDIVVYQTTASETVAVQDEPQVVDLSADADTELLDSLTTSDVAPQTAVQMSTVDTVGIVSAVDEDAGTLTVISGNVDGKVAEVTLPASQVTTLVSVASAQAMAGDGASEQPADGSSGENPDGLDSMTPGGSITNITVNINDEEVHGDLKLTDGDKLTLDYSYLIPAGTIKTDSDRTLAYHLPEGIYLSSAINGSDIKQGSTVVGKLYVSKDGQVTLVFDENFSADQPFRGSFGFEARVTTDEIGDGGTIKFPSGDVVITVEDKTSLNLSKKANGFEERDGKVYAKYTITVSSKNGWKDPITIHDQLDNSNASAGLSGKYVQNSFVLTDSKGNVLENYSPEFSGNSFDLKDLPALNSGEKYVLTYEVEITNKSTDGSGKFYNTAWVQPDAPKDATATHSKYIEKSSKYDPDDGYIYWTVTVYNPDGGDLNGTALSDTVKTSGAEIVGDVTVTDSDTGATFDTIHADGQTKFDYTFSQLASSSQYTFTYKTKVPAGVKTVDNHAEIKRNNGIYSADDTGKVTERDWGVKKTASGTLTETGTEDLYTAEWSFTTPVPANWTSHTIVDNIKVPSKGKGGDHYGIADKLDEEIKEKLYFICTDGTRLSYTDAVKAGIGINVTYYTSDSPKDKTLIALPNDKAHVQSFQIELTNHCNGKSVIKSLSIDGYHTYIDVSGVAEGTKVDFTNKAGGDSDKYTYTKTKPIPALSKGVSKSSTTDPSKSGSYSDSVDIDYNDEKNNYIYYQLTLNVADWTSFPKDPITVEDTPDHRVVFDTSNSKYPYATFQTGSKKFSQTVGSYNLSENFHWSEENGKVTFYLDNLKTISETDAAGIQAILIRYQVRVNDTAWNDPDKETETYTNTAAWGDSTAHAEATFNRKVKVLDKTAKQKGATDSRATYSIVINPTAKNLSSTNTVTLTDTMTVEEGFTAHLDLDTVKLYSYPKQNGDAPLPDTLYGLSYESYTNSSGQNEHKMIFTLPDEQAFVLEYDYVTDAQNKKVKLSNTAHIEGVADSKKDTSLKEVNGWAKVEQGLLTLYKVDSGNQKVGLSDAVFTLYKFDASTGKWDTGTVLPATDANGSLSLYVGKNNFVTIETSTLYKLVETSAPEGYRKSDREYFFIWTDNSSQPADDAYNKAIGSYTGKDVPTQDKVSIYTHGTPQELYVPNERSQLTIQKFWMDENGKLLTGTRIPEASVTVHLYRYKDGTTKANRDTNFDESITLNYENNWTFTYKGVASGYHYYIEEDPIAGTTYDVIYSDSNTLGVANGGLLTVTNKQTPAGSYELPSTGGAGTTLYTAVGGAMMLAALVCGFCKKRRRERRVH